MKRAGAEVGRFDGRPDEVRLTDPRPLLMRQNYRDGMPGGLEGVDERVDIGRRLVRRGAVVVDYLQRGAVSNASGDGGKSPLRQRSTAREVPET